MKLIKTLILNNICRIENAEIEFGMLTKVIGENDAGKSTSIYNTLEIVLLGENFSEDMVRIGCKRASIEVVFTDGSSTYWERAGKKQLVILKDASGSTRDYTTVKDIVPLIREHSGCTEVILDKSSGKESFQFVPLDAPQTYLLHGVAPSTVLRRITKVVGGSGAETAKQKIEADKRKLQNESDIKTTTLNTVEQRFQTLWPQIDLPEIENHFETIKNNMDVISSKQATIEKVDQLLEEETRLLQRIDGAAHTASWATTQIALMEQNNRKIEAIKTTLRTCDYLLNQEDDLQTLVGTTNSETLLAIDADIILLSQKKEDQTQIENELSKISVLILEKVSLTTNLETSEKEITNLNSMIQEAQFAQNTRSKACKECGQALPVIAA